ncbi:MAG TPA: DUF4199 family protein [Pyrinomonadaceae bacterium]|nr:DUF4199 family protein [Pyrinomonadaceae bacterium]
MTKIAIKYGLLITAVVAAWIVIVRFGMGVEPESKANIIAPILFNITAIIAIFLGMSARKRELNGSLGFKEGVKTGMAISLVYAVSACLFFMIEYLVAGPELLMSEGIAQGRPLWQAAVFAYAGLFFVSLFFGLIYSTVIASILAKRRSEESSEII